MIVSRFPFPLEKGDKLRAYHQLIQLSKLFRVTLVCLSDSPIKSTDRSEVAKWCEALHVVNLSKTSKLLNSTGAFFSSRPIQTGYFYSVRGKKLITTLIEKASFKHIYCQLIRTTEYVKNIHHIPKSLDYMDALSAGIERRIKKQPFYSRWLFILEAKRLRKYEQRIFDFFENKTIISEQDRKLIFHPEAQNIVTVPNGVDSNFLEKISRLDKYDLVFVGNMNYPPNIEAVQFISKNILSKRPNLSLLISGSTPHPSVTKLASKNVTVSGWVDDIRESYVSGRIFIAPMTIGTGQQNKLLEAMALGTPCITTSLSNNAINAKDGKEIIVSENAADMLKKIDELLGNQELRQKIASSGQKFVRENYSWEKSTKPLIDLLKNS